MTLADMTQSHLSAFRFVLMCILFLQWSSFTGVLLLLLLFLFSQLLLSQLFFVCFCFDFFAFLKLILRMLESQYLQGIISQSWVCSMKLPQIMLVLWTSKWNSSIKYMLTQVLIWYRIQRAKYKIIYWQSTNMRKNVHLRMGHTSI